MLYALLNLYLAIYYIRPSEWMPGIIGIPLFLIVGVLSLLFVIGGILSNKLSYALSGSTEKMMYGFLMAIVLSHLCHFYLGGITKSLTNFIPVFAGFLLISSSINNRKKLESFILLLILLTSFLAYEGCLQYTTGFAHGGMEPLIQNNIIENGYIEKIPRIRWYGVFNDPNDLGLVLVLVFPFLLNMVLDRRYILPIVCFPLIATSLYFTNSRGSILAGLVSVLSYFIIRYKSIKGLFWGVSLSAVLITFGPSRMSSLSASEDSAHGRIYAWYEAYQLFKSNPLFGIGQGMFTDFHFITAHNSFVLVMSELGIFGLFFFTGLIYFPINRLWSIVFRANMYSLSKEELGLISAVFASLFGVLVSMFFISRSYMFIPYLLFSLSMASTRILTVDQQTEDKFSETSAKHYKNLAIITILQIVVINIVVKILI